MARTIRRTRARRALCLTARQREATVAGVLLAISTTALSLCAIALFMAAHAARTVALSNDLSAMGWLTGVSAACAFGLAMLAVYERFTG